MGIISEKGNFFDLKSFLIFNPDFFFIYLFKIINACYEKISSFSHF
jgi:hypothetical protein